MLREIRARLNLYLGNRIRWRRGEYSEAPAKVLRNLQANQAARIAALNAIYPANFESRFDTSNSLENYLYLDLLHRLRTAAADDWPRGGTVVDAGSKNFYYAPVLHAVLSPDKLIGVEIEGYRLYRNFYSRYDYAKAYIRDLKNTGFVVADFRQYRCTADVITCLYPFVFRDTHINWHLPANRFDPAAYFDAVVRNLEGGGKLIMINQGEEEAEAARQLCAARGLEHLTGFIEKHPLIKRTDPPACSLWCKPTSKL